MEHHYNITGMSCNGCRSKVEKVLNEIEDIRAIVTLEPPVATLNFNKTISVEVLQSALSGVGNYSIIPVEHLHQDSKSNCCSGHIQVAQSDISNILQSKNKISEGKYYCPMFCEGQKEYNKAGDCPVCGMDLVSMVAADEDRKIYNDLVRKMKIALLFTLPVFIIAMAEMMENNPLMKIMETTKWNWVQMLLSLPVVFYIGQVFFVRAWRSILTWNLNMFTLIGIGTGAAFLFSISGLLFPGIFPEEFSHHQGSVHLYFESATVIITLVLLGQLLEARAHNRTSGAVKELLNLSPSEATILINGQSKIIGIQDIKKGDVLRVKPGDKIPVDGRITDGESSINESMISGEPLPADKKKGDIVMAGTINGNKSFDMIAEKIGSETLLSQIIAMVNDASRSRAPIQKLADRIAAYFVPVVVIVSVITFIVWTKFGPEPALVYGFINAIAVLIIACPCALGLATPMSVMVGVGKGAQSGVLIKNAEALEKMDQVDILIIDKTGTITEGKPSVDKIFSIDNQEDKLLQIISSLNKYSEHPLAKAILNYAEYKHIQLCDIKDFEAVAGKGVFGILGAEKVAAGNKKLMEQIGAIISEDLEARILSEQELGKTVSYIASDSIVLGFVSVSDALKQSSVLSIKELMRQGIEVIMLTGDHQITAKAVADVLHLASFKAGVLPEDKWNEIKRLQSEGKIVAMAGDGINDAPALAQADIGIAMGTGTDVAIESASITLIKGDLMGIVKVKKLSRAVMRNIRQNLFFAFFYNMVGIPVAAGILFPFFGILLSPMIAALAMSFSSVSVIGNALRLRNLKL